MPKVSLDIPNQLLEDMRIHVGDNGKFVSLADAIRTACRKMLDQLDEIDARHGRIEVKWGWLGWWGRSCTLLSIKLLFSEK